MPRKTSQAVAKDTAATDTKNEGSGPRRSGRAVAKQETSGKDAIRSRRSSTAAQTAASVADSRTPKGRTSVSSQRESASPSDSRTRTGRESGVESPAARAKSSRRNASRVNYKESDGEEEAATPKYDENFESAEEVEESESDEKSKPRGRSRASKTPTKNRSPKEKAKGSAQSRRGRPSKKKDSDEVESETIDVSEDSVEPEETPSKRGRTTKAPVKESPRPSRSRRQRAEPAETKSKRASEEKPKQSRRSSRTSSSKEETPKKRPSRSIQAKRYTEEEEEEEDEEDVEEITETKPEEEESKKDVEGGRKRKRASTPEESNKRLKETETKPDEVEVDEAKEEEATMEEEEEEEKKTEVKSAEEPMEVDESDSVHAPETEKEPETVKEEEELSEQIDSEAENISKDDEIVKDEEEQDIAHTPSKDKQSELNQPENIEKAADLDESSKSSESDEESQPEDTISSSIEDSQKTRDTLKETVQEQERASTIQSTKSEVSPEKPKEVPSQTSEIPQPVEEKSEESKSLPPPVIPETNEKSADKNEHIQDTPVKKDTEIVNNDSCVSEEIKSPPVDKISTVQSSGSSIPVTSVTGTQLKEPVSDASLNGAEKEVVTKPSRESPSSDIMNTESEEQNTLKANGAHNDVQHTNSTSPSKEQYYSLPGRRYVINAKLSENLRQSLKNQAFSFISYNLGTSSPDAYIQKDKLLHELNKLDAHLICLQQVAKPFYTAVLEPSLDALGFKSTFSQPEDNLKGMATFYKGSLFRLCEQSTVSLKQLVEKELEASSLDAADRSAVKAHVRKCGSVLFCHFSTVIGSQTVTVANVQIPPTDLSIHALQVSCLAREVVRINGGNNKPLLIGGEFNIAENDASYQLLKDGYLSNEMIEELQRRKDVVLPEKENASLVNLLWKSFQHPSSNLCSCYTSVLGHEIFIPELKLASPDLIWYSSDSLHTIGVLDATSDKPGDRHLSLKADIAFAV